LSTPYHALADAVLVLHALFVAFVVLGFGAILIGRFSHWRWAKNPVFRIVHLLSIGFVVLQSWFDQLCPLTVWENELRQKAGQAGYSESFIASWLHKILFYQVEPWVFTMTYTIFGAVVFLFWIMARRDKE
jgi:hypothetical protein